MSALTPHYIFPKASELIRLKQFAKSPEFKKSLSTSQLAGQWKSIFKGRSMDFDEVRSYQSGDDIRSIDWNISAKTGELHTQIYKEEKERPVLIMVDYSSSMHFGTRKKFKCTLAAEIASIYAFSLINKGDRIGGLIFDESSHREIRPKMQLSGVLQLIHHLTIATKNNESHNQNEGLKNKFESAIKKLARLSKPGMALFIISDFLNFNETVEKYLIQMAQHCQVNLCMVYDPIERNLPNVEFDIDSEGERFRIGGFTQEVKKHQEYFESRINEIKNFSKRKNFTFSLISTDDDLTKYNLNSVI